MQLDPVRTSDVKKHFKDVKTRLDFTFSCWQTLRSVLIKREGKNYDKRTLDQVKAEFNKMYGEKNIHYIAYSDIASMRSIKVKFHKDCVFADRDELSYLVAYLDRDGKEINIERLDNQNQCWELDATRSLDMSQYLQSDLPKDLARATNKLNNALSELEGLLEANMSYPKYDSWKYDYFRKYLSQSALERFKMTVH
jgi:hypothetical protein